MKNPSLKNGYFPIANELAEALARSSISGSEVRILWVVFRKTWGWSDGDKRKDFDKISLSQFVEATEMKHTNVAKALKSLVVNRLLLKSDKGYGINQDYDQWVVVKRLPRNGSSLQAQSSSLQTTKKSSLQTTKSSSLLHIHKRKKEKKETTKETTPPSQGKAPKELLQGQQWNDLIDGFSEVNPMFLSFYKHKTQRSALQDIVNAIGYEKTLWLVMHLKHATSKPYAPRITTPIQLRTKLGELQTFWAQERQKQETTNSKNTSRVGKI